MNNLKTKFTEYMISMRTRTVAKRLKKSVSFPIQANSIRKVLVILPRNPDLLDRASHFVQTLRKTFPEWRIELFDVDKLNKNDLTSMQLPRPEILQKLKRADYHFVMDLNDIPDQLSSFIALMTEAPYRLHLQPNGSPFFNIAYSPPRKESAISYEPLINYLLKLFVQN